MDTTERAECENVVSVVLADAVALQYIDTERERLVARQTHTVARRILISRNYKY